MCGIVGMIAKTQQGFNYSEMELFQSMLISDSIRGEDSTGVFGVYKNKQARTLKVAAEPHNLFRCDEWSEFRAKAISSMNVIIGHNRYATRGAVNSVNAHPFSEGKICLVHNGTLNNQKDFNKEVEVDSHAIAHAFNERPAAEVLSEIDGAFAFIWYNRETGKLNITRNSDRPLAYIETANNIYIASEGDMLNWLVNRKSTTNYQARLFKTNTIYSYDSKGVAETTEYEPFRPKLSGIYANQSNYELSGSQQNQSQVKTTTKDTTDINGPLVFKNGDTPIIKVTELLQETINGNIRVKGKTVWPVGGEDFTGMLERGLNKDDLNALLKNTMATGVVRGTLRSVCGNSYWIGEIAAAPMTKLYQTSIPEELWKHLVVHGKCDKCGGKLKTNQADLTSVKIKNKTNQFRIVCADCVTEALDEATSTKQQNSSIEVSTRKSIGESITDITFREINKECIIH